LIKKTIYIVTFKVSTLYYWCIIKLKLFIFILLCYFCKTYMGLYL
jgi:hypothetical protein